MAPRPKITPTDLSGGASTPENTPFTVGDASRAKGIVSALAPRPDTPAARSLLQAYKSWEQRQATKVDMSGVAEQLASLRKQLMDVEASLKRIEGRRG